MTATPPAILEQLRGVTRAGDGWTAAMLLTFTTEPPSPAAIRSANSDDNRNGPFRFTASTLSYSSSLTSVSDAYRGDMPALLTSTSARPKRS